MKQKKKEPRNGAGLLTKKINDGKLSLFIDFYPPLILSNGKETRRETLNLHVLANPKTLAQKEEYNQTYARATAILADRKQRITNGDYSFLDKRKKDSDSFIAFYQKLAQEKSSSMYQSSLNYVKAYKGDKMSFRDVDVKFFNGFKKYLAEQKLKTNSIHLYCSNVITVIKEAHKADLLEEDIMHKLDLPKKEQTERSYLEIDEIQKLIEMPCKNPMVKQMFLFSCYTGLRVSDCLNLKFENVINKEDGYYLKFQQKKTKAFEMMPINEIAYSFIPQRKADTDKVFEDLSYSTYFTTLLSCWVFDAGISKPITFHSARHTYACLLITLGADLYSVSKLLGHKDIGTTQIYAKVIDSKKREAVDLLNKLNKLKK